MGVAEGVAPNITLSRLDNVSIDCKRQWSPWQHNNLRPPINSHLFCFLMLEMLLVQMIHFQLPICRIGSAHCEGVWSSEWVWFCRQMLSLIITSFLL